MKPDLNKSAFFLLVLAGLILAAVFRVDSNSGFLYWVCSSIALIVLFSVLALPLEKLIYPVFILIVLMPDITHASDSISALESLTVASPWQFRLGLVTPAILIFFFLLVVAYRLFSLPERHPYYILFFFFLIVSSFVSFWFGFYQDSFSQSLSDAKVPIYYLSGLIIFTSYYRRFPRKLKISCKIFLALALGGFLFDLGKLLFTKSFSPNSASYAVLSFDSAKGLITIFTFLAIANIIKNKNVLFNYIIIAITLYMLISYQTRWILITFVGGLILVVCLVGWTKTAMKSLLLILFLSFSMPLIVQLNPEVFRVARIRFSFIDNIRGSFKLQDIDSVRGASILNSTSVLRENSAFLTGMGYGSWYDDSSYSMSSVTLSAFDNASVSSGKFYRVHDFFFHFLFKFGIIGTSLYLYTFIKPARNLLKLRRVIATNSLGFKAGIVLLGILPLVVTYLFWTGKGLLLSALFVVLANEWIKAIKKSVRNQKNS